MLIPSPEIKDNVAEYVLYMWQVEDLIRACKLDIDVISQNILHQLDSNEELKSQTKDWYQELINNMRSEGVVETGHLLEIREILNELFYLHTFILNSNKDEAYKKIFDHALTYIQEFQTVSGMEIANPVELCFNGMYAKLILSLQKKEISDSTEEAFDAFRVVLSHLSRSYKSMKKGELNYLMN